ncbi:hypothetical protein ROCKSTAR_53 [Mycobacterium phage Rockstar]|uniref:Uncharacterized protein n=8 Tax=Veracruzvirus TaxID=2948946 RepID=A0A8F3E2N4_9CAUD|nr:hypothetical protein M614_gp51 [Mycobacterium phage BTCU-1]YP_009614570.1 hypothetical protein FDI65_gp33 [Mycobacterium phage Rockstar]YP_009637678.1 hypothetical protein FGG19_gp44 [Mycobacterium phage HelDan]YP_010060414.1 hypothetical protein KIP28_gp38 [Mycobacterium phage MA5]ASW31311.1 hypothetical protein SEA_FRED313_53 [Mycobacterium phage Fred313]QGJ97334.1 hypothetical protein PBI_ISCA_52 [Mycobacterium phage Isca]QJD52028.1 hypothetical protein PBI_MK4_53 [Mycobacterium phage M
MMLTQEDFEAELVQDSYYDGMNMFEQAAQAGLEGRNYL